MNDVLDKELISYLLKLETDQQEKVLGYIKELLIADEMKKRADASEKAIEESRMKSFDQFNEDFEKWKIQKRMSTK